jgi:hypothetical protein
MWVLYFVIGFSTILTFNNNYENMYVWATKVHRMCNTRVQGICLLTSRGQI